MTEEDVLDKLEKADCPLCGGSDFTTIIRARDFFFGVPGVFTVSRCRGCSLVMQNPRPAPDTMADFYPQDYEPHLLVANEAALDEVVEGQESRREILESYVPKGKNLDVGSGDGRFILCLKRAGWDAVGCEFVEKAARFQRETLGLDVVVGDLVSAGYPADHFDSITLWSVYEHLYDPVESIVEMCRILKPGGVVVINVPNFNSLERIVFGKYWFPLCLPHHLFFFTPATMKKIVKKAGMKIERTIYSTSATGLLRSTRNIIRLISKRSEKEKNADAPPAIVGESPEGKSEARGMKKIVFSYLVVPALKVLDALHAGGTTTYIIRKTGN
ncbi:class I SAM-dependent methyltransferase [bacterium]